jgi:glycine dehydrogenase
MSMIVDDERPFLRRHLGSGPDDVAAMLERIGETSMESFLESVIPSSIRLGGPLEIDARFTEESLLETLRAYGHRNTPARSLIGMGYYDTITPPVILRNVLENPGWYTAYTPYQSEIAQGRLEALLNFQTVVMDLTAMQIANASLLDEATAAAEGMGMFYAIRGRPRGGVFLVAEDCHPQTIAVVQTRARALGIKVVIDDPLGYEFSETVFGTLLQYPTSDGAVRDYRSLCQRAHRAGTLVAVATDLLALTLLEAPGSWGADCALGSAQRFGVPPGYGGPHAAFFATREEYKRFLPGRVIGVSLDSRGQRALRMALQTREQHIRREKATSNICTAQVLLAVMASFYAVYHGPRGLRAIALRTHSLTRALAEGIRLLGHEGVHGDFFDTLRIVPRGGSADAIREASVRERINLRHYPDGSLGVSLDERSDEAEIVRLLRIMGRSSDEEPSPPTAAADYTGIMKRTTSFLEHPVFHLYRSETEMLRYIHRLEARDLALNVSMIPLGSCTMKLNATAEMIPVTWQEFSRIHPFAPPEQAQGYHKIFAELSRWLGEITGFPAVSLQPNAGAQGEYTGLLTIRAYHQARGQEHRTVCLIPSSAHGTNPASAVMAGLEVVIVGCDARGNVDLEDLHRSIELHRERLAALMVTYPSTHGVFEEQIIEICRMVHEAGGQVYMDGANLNAQVGLCRPAEMGADVCHINLHKTFCIPHGGGGPGMGPIAVADHLAPYLPGHPVIETGGREAIGPVSAAPWGSANILLISWAYIALMGGDGLRRATELALLNANYMARRLQERFSILYRGERGRVAHEFIIDLREFKESAGIEAEDVAKRLMDYGFHAPTVSFPVAGTMMIEPTESESRAELDRFCEALLSIREEIRAIEEGHADRQDNLLRNAPHTAEMVTADSWAHPYSREQAAFPASWTRSAKFWPPVGRVNNAYGDRHVVCSCPPIEAYLEPRKEE